MAFVPPVLNMRVCDVGLCPACGGWGVVYAANCPLCYSTGLMPKEEIKTLMRSRYYRIVNRSNRDHPNNWPSMFTNYYPDYTGPAYYMDTALTQRLQWMVRESSERSNPFPRPVPYLPGHPSWETCGFTPQLRRLGQPLAIPMPFEVPKREDEEQDVKKWKAVQFSPKVASTKPVPAWEEKPDLIDLLDDPSIEPSSSGISSSTPSSGAPSTEPSPIIPPVVLTRTEEEAYIQREIRGRGRGRAFIRQQAGIPPRIPTPPPRVPTPPAAELVDEDQWEDCETSEAE